MCRPLLDEGQGKHKKADGDCRRGRARGQHIRQRPQDLADKKGDAPTVTDCRYAGTKRHEDVASTRIKTSGRVRTNPPHDVTIAHMVGSLPLMHETMSSAEDEVRVGSSMAVVVPPDLGI